jgi:hypothetical protein
MLDVEPHKKEYQKALNGREKEDEVEHMIAGTDTGDEHRYYI